MFGSTATQTAYYGTHGMLQINNDIYIIKTLANVAVIEKYTIGTAEAVATYTFADLLGQEGDFYWYYNGTKIIITYLDRGVIPARFNRTYLATINLDLTGFTDIMETNVDQDRIGLPWNMDDVPENTIYVWTGAKEGISGNILYTITNNKFT